MFTNLFNYRIMFAFVLNHTHSEHIVDR